MVHNSYANIKKIIKCIIKKVKYNTAYENTFYFAENTNR